MSKGRLIYGLKFAYNEALELENYHYADKFSVQKSKYKEQADLIAQDIKLKLADENLALAASDKKDFN